MTLSEDEFKNKLADDPGNPIFAEYAEYLRAEKRYPEAMDVCFTGLSQNPGCHKGRLVLARLFYEKLYIPFAVRELDFLRIALPESVSIKKLLDKLAPGVERGQQGVAANNESGVTVAETDFSVEELEMLEEEESK